MESYGARCVASPSEETESGRHILAEHPDSTGSLGIAISEAVEMAAGREDIKYALGSVLNHVLTHQTVIGQEAMAQLEMADDYPDVIVGCTGGGSNFAGIAFPFLGAKLRGGTDARLIAVEPSACPSLTKGKYAYDFGDTGHLTPLVKMHTLGSTFVPPGFHAGGLRYHGMAPMISHLTQLGLIEPEAHTQTACFEAGIQFARAEGILPAPEANHAVKGTIDEALRCKEEGTSRASSLTSAAMGISTCRPIPIISPAISSTSPMTNRNWRWRWPDCPRWRLSRFPIPTRNGPIKEGTE